MQLRVLPSGEGGARRGLGGEVCVAGDKSISHRAVMLAAIAEGRSRIFNLLQGEDVRATVGAFRQMGVEIVEEGDGVRVEGVGLYGLQQPKGVLDMGNSGTGMRLLAGLLCAQPWGAVVDGDASLRGRPMGRIIAPLREMGGRIASQEEGEGCPPLEVGGVADSQDSAFPFSLRAIRYAPRVASAQVKSCLLLAGLYAEGATEVCENAQARDHTERMLRAFGVGVDCEEGEGRSDGDARVVRLRAVEQGRARVLRGRDIDVPADLSSAAFFLVGASVMAGSDVTLRNVGVNATRSGVVDILKRMGADIELRYREGGGGGGEGGAGGEPVADIRVRAAALRGCRIGGADVARAIDEIPALAVAAACAQGETEIRDAEELRVKESDRIRGVVEGLGALGVGVSERRDGLTISGGGLRGGRVDSLGDHRLAMAFAMAGGVARGDGGVEIMNCANIATSFPGFVEVARGAGLDVRVE